MKVAILTITDGQNYGNRLQNYALQQLLRRSGCDAETIHMSTFRDRNSIQEYKLIIKQIIKRFLQHKNTCFGQLKRKKKFQQFNSMIEWSDYSLKSNIIPVDIDKAYDCFVCGSDQVWNLRFKIVEENIHNHLAYFAPKEKKISYAASFGTGALKPGTEELFRKELSSFKALGVREEAGKQLIEKLCNRRDAQVVLDPTMMLSTEEWASVAKKPLYVKKQRFIVTYFLGGRSETIKNYITAICQKYQAVAFNLDIEFLKDNEIENQDVFCTSPDEFVWLMQHAECILTDSFHATVFSILFHKPFAVFQRKAVEEGNDMGSRIDTLLGRFSLGMFCGDINQPDITPSNYDFDAVDAVLKKEQVRSERFLTSALQ